MGWTVTGWAAVHNYGSLTIWHETWAAVRERSLAAGVAFTLTEPVLNHNFGSLSFINAWQTQIENLLSYYAVSHNTTTGAFLGAGYYDGAASFPTYTLATVFAAAFPGEGRTDWRRYNNLPGAAHTDLGGKQWVDNIIGPWCFEDLQKVLKVMVWTKLGGQFSGVAWKSAITKYSGESDTDWPTAKANAETNWAGSSNDPEFMRYMWSRGELDAPQYNAFLGSCRGVAQIVGLNDFVAKAVEWYNLGSAYGVFNNNGELVNNGTYKLWLTDNLAANCGVDIDSSAAFPATTDHPVWVDEPLDGEELSTGFQTAPYPIVIVRWNIVGGFVYT